jgi:hypothetical protein
MAELSTYPRITAAGLSSTHILPVIAPSGDDPRNRSIIVSEVLAWLAANGLIASALIDEPNGVAGLDENGNLVGPIVLSTYANAAAAGVLDEGELAVVDGKLVLGDNATTGGNRVGGVTPGLFLVNATGSITLDPFSGHAVIFSTMVDDAITITINNIADIPLGYLIYLYVDKTGAAETITIQGLPEDNVNVLDSFTVGSALSSLVIARKSTAATFGWVILQNTSV